MSEENGIQDRLNIIRTAAKPAEAEEFANHACYGVIRGNRRAFNIELRRMQGSWPAPEYAWLHYAEWCPVSSSVGSLSVPAGSIVLHMQSGEKVIVSGRNLREVHDKILGHRVYYVAEANRTQSFGSKTDEIVVESIQWQIPERH